MTSPWHVEFYEDNNGRRPVEEWLNDLSDVKYAAIEAAITHKLAVKGVGLSGSAWMTPLGEGLYELRVRHSADEIRRMYETAKRAPAASAVSEKILLRVFVSFYGDKNCILFSGYDKGRAPSAKRQQTEIAKARKLRTEWQLRQRKERHAGRGKR
jgi:hypothetical protein